MSTRASWLFVQAWLFYLLHAYCSSPRQGSHRRLCFLFSSFCFYATGSKFTVAWELCRKHSRVAELSKVRDVPPTVNSVILEGDKDQKSVFWKHKEKLSLLLWYQCSVFFCCGASCVEDQLRDILSQKYSLVNVSYPIRTSLTFLITFVL